MDLIWCLDNWPAVYETTDIGGFTGGLLLIVPDRFMFVPLMSVQPRRSSMWQKNNVFVCLCLSAWLHSLSVWRGDVTVLAIQWCPVAAKAWGQLVTQQPALRLTAPVQLKCFDVALLPPFGRRTNWSVNVFTQTVQFSLTGSTMLTESEHRKLQLAPVSDCLPTLFFHTIKSASVKRLSVKTPGAFLIFAFIPRPLLAAGSFNSLCMTNSPNYCDCHLFWVHSCFSAQSGLSLLLPGYHLPLPNSLIPRLWRLYSTTYVLHIDGGARPALFLVKFFPSFSSCLPFKCNIFHCRPWKSLPSWVTAWCLTLPFFAVGLCRLIPDRTWYHGQIGEEGSLYLGYLSA